MRRSTQYFSEESLRNCKKMTPGQIAQFLEDFRILHGSTPPKKRLISMRISESLLQAVKNKSKTLGVPYQTQIQRLIQAWVANP